MKKDPLNILFGDETKDFFANISKNVFRNNTDFLNFKKEKVKDKEQGHFLGFVPSKYIGKLKWGAVIFVVLPLLWLIVRWIRKKVS